MLQDSVFAKIDILIQQGKYAEAEHLLQDMLPQDPENVYLMTLLAQVYIQQQKATEANLMVARAIGLEPDSAPLFYLKTRVQLAQEEYDGAEESIHQAIVLNPNDADYFALHATIKLSRKQYQAALALANQALAIDPEQLLALNTRSTTLLKLHQGEASFQTIEGALREDPTNAYTHANYGWGLLEKGDHKKAREHFQEALQNDPTLEFAQAGLLEAIKAGNPVYRLFLKYAFWIGNLTAKYQWGFILGLYLGMRLLDNVADSNPTLAVFLRPVLLVLTVMVFSTWLITPISNLFLRFNRYGKLLLDKKQKLSSNLVAIAALVFIGGLVMYLAGNDDRFLMVIAYGLGMMILFGSMLSPAKNTYVLPVYTAAMAIVGLLAIAGSFTPYSSALSMYSTYFLVGLLAYQFLANYMIIREDNR